MYAKTVILCVILIALALVLLIMMDRLGSFFGIAFCGVLSFCGTTIAIRQLLMRYDTRCPSTQNCSEQQQRSALDRGNVTIKINANLLDWVETVLLEPEDVPVPSDSQTFLHETVQCFDVNHPGSESQKDEHMNFTSVCSGSNNYMKEVRVFVHNISCYYIKSWYFHLSQDREFPDEIGDILEDVLFAAGTKLSKLNVSLLFHEILLCCHQHFSVYLRALEMLSENEKKQRLADYTAFDSKIEEAILVTHAAVLNQEAEHSHLTTLSTGIVKVLAPPDVLGCPLVSTILIDIIAHKVLLPLVHRLGDPNWLNWIIFTFLSEEITHEETSSIRKRDFVEMTSNQNFVSDDHHSSFSYKSIPKRHVDSDAVSQETEPTTRDSHNVKLHLNLRSGAINKKKDLQSVKIKPFINSGQEVRHQDDTDDENEYLEVRLRNVTTSPGVTRKEPSSEWEVWSVDVSKQTEKHPLNLSPGMSCIKPGTPTVLLTSPDEENQPVSVEPVVSRTQIKRSKSLDIISQVIPRLTQVLPIRDGNTDNECEKYKLKKGNANSLPRAIQDISPQKEKGEIEPTEIASEAIESDSLPSLFTDICIKSTEQQHEPGRGPFTLYCIHYEALYILSPDDDGEDQTQLVKHASTVKRRFREFLTLQSRLEDNKVTCKHLKGIKGPSKWLATPFYALDKKNIEERRVFLQSYLVKLCSREVVANSPELKEFLAYGIDASIAYVRKANEVGVPRIDKMFVRGVKGAIDLIRTALPSLPQDMNENIPDLPGEKYGQTKSLLPVFGRSRAEERRLDIEFQYLDEKTTNLEHQMYKYINSFESASSPDISPPLSPQNQPRTLSLLSRNKSGKDKLLSRIDSKTSMESSRMLLSESSVQESVDKVEKVKRRIKKEVPLASAVIDLGLLTITDSNYKYRKSNVVLVLKILLGQLLNRWLEKKLTKITTQEQCAQYLHLLHEALWPKSENNENSVPQQDLAFQALKSFFSFLTPVVFSSSQYEESLSLLLGSLQNEKLNKCLVYHLLDILVDMITSQDT
ncbi:sorting nexin-19-like [Limulus polyphemus]|uniref:Sorting nexin-19-like n=1 Tax=Limulus polyphemus TaxID=6850 RepID=A0ABM1TB46_LIMPO|nr:sorting nexin-19-like [Limulus polyphemus]